MQNLSQKGLMDIFSKDLTLSNSLKDQFVLELTQKGVDTPYVSVIKLGM